MGFQCVKPVINYSVRELCYRPYYNHPHGCPNYGKKKTCPPEVSLFEQIIDLAYPVFVIWNIFDLATHREKIKRKHPEWSDRQLNCCLYWQPTARKILDIQITIFRLQNPEIDEHYLIIKNPEALGINVTETMKSIGIELEWPPKTKTYQVALTGKAFYGGKS